MAKLNIGDHLFRYTGVSIIEYEVYGVVSREVGTLYEIMSLSCRSHDSCHLLIAESKDNYGFKFIDMIDQDEQAYWHNDNDPYQRFQLTKNEAVKNRLEWTINSYKEENAKSRKSIEFNENKIKEFECTIDALNVSNKF